MTPTIEMTRTQEQRFYRNAVQSSLEQFYGKSRPEASRLVRDWSRRLSQSGALDSELFLHAEPINTAAGIAEMVVIPVNSRNREAYHRILSDSQNLVLTQVMPKATPRETEPEKKDARRQKRFATSSKSGLIKGAAVKARAQKAKESKASEKQQVAFG